MKNLILIVFLMGLMGCSTGFSQEDIDATQTAIEKNFASRGAVNPEAKLIKMDSKHLTGFVKYTIDGAAIQFTCTATMGENSMYIWECK